MILIYLDSGNKTTFQMSLQETLETNIIISRHMKEKSLEKHLRKLQEESQKNKQSLTTTKGRSLESQLVFSF